MDRNTFMTALIATSALAVGVTHERLPMLADELLDPPTISYAAPDLAAYDRLASSLMRSDRVAGAVFDRAPQVSASAHTFAYNDMTVFVDYGLSEQQTRAELARRVAHGAVFLDTRAAMRTPDHAGEYPSFIIPPQDVASLRLQPAPHLAFQL